MTKTSAAPAIDPRRGVALLRASVVALKCARRGDLAGMDVIVLGSPDPRAMLGMFANLAAAAITPEGVVQLAGISLPGVGLELADGARRVARAFQSPQPGIALQEAVGAVTNPRGALATLVMLTGSTAAARTADLDQLQRALTDVILDSHLTPATTATQGGD
jgi:hypothetical protein